MSTTSARPGPVTSAAEVVDISPAGLWLIVDGREYFVDFSRHPWFRAAKIEAVFRVERHGARHLHWPDLDVDLEVDSLNHPDLFPLLSRAGA